MEPSLGVGTVLRSDLNCWTLVAIYWILFGPTQILDVLHLLRFVFSTIAHIPAFAVRIGSDHTKITFILQQSMRNSGGDHYYFTLSNHRLNSVRIAFPPQSTTLLSQRLRKGLRACWNGNVMYCTSCSAMMETLHRPS